MIELIASLIQTLLVAVLIALGATVVYQVFMFLNF